MPLIEGEAIKLPESITLLPGCHFTDFRQWEAIAQSDAYVLL